MTDLTPYANQVAALLEARHPDAFEIMLTRSRDLAVEARNGQLDTFRCAEPFGVAVRVKVGSGLGFSFSTSFDEAALKQMVEGAVVGATMQTPDPFCVLPAPLPGGYPVLPHLYDPAFFATPDQEKVERALELERRVLAQDPRVKRVRKCSYSESVYQVLIQNSLGVAAQYQGTQLSLSASAVAEAEGGAQMGWDFAFSHRLDGVDPEKVAAGAAGKAVALLGARPFATMRCPVVLDRHVAAQLLEVLAGSFLGENVHKGKSRLAGRTGERIFSEQVSVRDNGLLENGMGSAPCDGEGVPQQDTALVTSGILQGFLYDSYWGIRLGAASTGNSVRGGVKGPPRLAAHNLHLQPGRSTPEELRAGIGRGVLITDVLGMHTANAISGDFSVGATGYYLEGGELVHPVKGIAIAGNLFELFNNVELVADDLRFFGSVGSPSLRIGELDVSGS
ncbi:peptidase [Geomonas silvestris]|uniref:Peptidase n=1 Tax=Geomonas silvestris TaxID=2740184 RepID=A0A6V8MK45_9BACT|nr:TldD/PmbA family protein [Geomonas silvestris]GFO60370.1 peptidase [Geomonas silvestris]